MRIGDLHLHKGVLTAQLPIYDQFPSPFKRYRSSGEQNTYTTHEKVRVPNRRCQIFSYGIDY